MSEKRERIEPPQRLSETINVDELGGPVIVRQMVLWQTLLAAVQPENTRTRVMAEIMAEAVTYPEGDPVFDAAGWDVWGANNVAPVSLLISKVRELTDKASSAKVAEGNSPGPTSDSG